MRNDWYIYFITALLITFILFLPKAYSETNTVSSTVTVDKTPPSANSPSMNIVNSDICKTGVSGAVQTQILGVSTGMTIQDENCERLKLSRMLYQQGLKVASVSLLCQDKRVFIAMKDAGTWCPFEGKIGEEAKELWLKNPTLRPDYDEIKNKQVVEQTTNGDWDAIKDFGLLALSMLLFI